MLSQITDYISRLCSSSGFFSAWAQRVQPSDERLGVAGEREAARFLKRLGYRILQANHRQKRGEIDLIALDGQTIVFVEVKTWRSDAVADPSEAVDLRKQRFLTRAALIYLKREGLMEHGARFDVVSVVWPEADRTQNKPPKIRHFINAFEAAGY